MLPKPFILLFLLILPMAQSFELDLPVTNLKTEFSVKCFEIMRPLLQDIAAKKQKIDRFDAILSGKETQLAAIQSKYDQVEIKLAVVEALVVEKERQLLQQTDLCNTHRNNSNLKDELLRVYRIQVLDKSTQIEQLQRQVKEQTALLDSCALESEKHIAEIKQLEAVAQANQLKLEQTADAQIQMLLIEAKETNEQLQNHKTQVKNKDKQIEMLQLQQQDINLKMHEQEITLKTKEQEKERSQTELNKMVEQGNAYKLQVDESEKQIKLQETVIENLQAELTKAQAQLSDYRSQLDGLSSTNCYSFGNSSDIHRIAARTNWSIEVLCDSSVAGPGWTVIQRRFDGSENFYRNWSEYRDGFGDLHGEFFIGMEKLYRLTISQSYELYVYLESFDNSTYYAHYAGFRIGSETESYALNFLGQKTGNATDGFLYARSRKFSTYDVDNDNDYRNCAKDKHGAWWYSQCGVSNLNGRYFNESLDDGILWHGFMGLTFKSVKMMLRPTSV